MNGGRQRQVQNEDAGVVRCKAARQRLAPVAARHALNRGPLGRQDEEHEPERHDAERADQPENARNTDRGGEQGTRNQREHERRADADADGEHRARARFRPREIREKGRHGAGHGAETLHHARGHERGSGTRHRAQRGTRDVQEESDDDERLATDAIRPDTEGNLHHGLREPVSAHGEAGEERRPARQRARVKREHWQKQEQPQ